MISNSRNWRSPRIYRRKTTPIAVNVHRCAKILLAVKQFMALLTKNLMPKVARVPLYTWCQKLQKSPFIYLLHFFPTFYSLPWKLLLFLTIFPQHSVGCNHTNSGDAPFQGPYLKTICPPLPEKYIYFSPNNINHHRSQSKPLHR